MKILNTFVPYIRKYQNEFILGIGALIITDAMTLMVPWLIKEVVDALPHKPLENVLLKYVIFLFLISLVLVVGRFAWRKYMFGLSRKIEFDILNKLFKHLISLDRLWYQKQKTGDLMSRATNDLRAVRDFFGLGVLILIDAVFVIIMAVFMMCWINYDLTFKVFIPLPFISVLFYCFVKEIGKRHQAVQEHLGIITEHVQENLSGIRVLHAYVQEEFEKTKFKEMNREYIKKNLRVTKIFGIFTPTMVFAIGVAGMISLWIGGKSVIAEELTLGSFVAFNGYLMLLSWPMMGIGYVFNLTQKGFVGMNRVNDILLSKQRIENSSSNLNLLKEVSKIKLSRVCFTFPDENIQALQEINIDLLKGQTLGIVGVIGGGKTTLCEIILRFYDPDSGDVLISGKSIRDLPLSELRDCIGYVSQEPFLFSMSIRNNIILGREGVTEEEINKVVRFSGLDSDLDQFPEKLETSIGEKGVTLSGGQKQRIALARALLRNPKILILDDAFSNLDSEMEEKLLRNLKEHYRDTTKIIISHRFSALVDAENIIVLDSGKIVEQGEHSQLCRLKGVYANLFHSQSFARELEMIL